VKEGAITMLSDQYRSLKQEALRLEAELGLDAAEAISGNGGRHREKAVVQIRTLLPGDFVDGLTRQRRLVLTTAVAEVAKVRPTEVAIHHVAQQHKQRFDGKMHYGPIGARLELNLLVVLPSKAKAEDLVASVWTGDFVDAVLEEMEKASASEEGIKALKFPPDFRAAQICTSPLERKQPNVCHYGAKDVHSLQAGVQEADLDMFGTLLPVMVGTSLFFFGVWFAFSRCSQRGSTALLPTHSGKGRKGENEMKRNLKLMQQAKKCAKQVGDGSENPGHQPPEGSAPEDDDSDEESATIRRKSWG
jgi:hypothetical protein